MKKALPLLLISLSLLLPHSVNAKTENTTTSISEPKVGKIIAYFNRNDIGDLLPEDDKSNSVYYRKYLGKSKEGFYVIQDFYQINDKKQIDSIYVKELSDLYSIEPDSIDGPMIGWHENGQKEFEGKYVKGKKEGLWIFWHEDGQKGGEGQFVNGKREGVWVVWSESGQKAAEGRFIDDEKEGLWTEWHENGQKAAEGKYVKDEREGPWTLWHENGQKKAEGVFANAHQRNGLWAEWYENGQKAVEGKFVGGKKEGLWTEWYENGQKEAMGQFINDKKEGLWTEWYENGQKKMDGKYTDDKSDGFWREWHENGQKWREGKYANDKFEGVWTFWYDNGQRREKGEYVKGGKVGSWAFWHENGQKEAEGKYVKGQWSQKNGPWIQWYKNGQKREEGKYVNGEKEGEWTYWYEDGQKEAEGKYVNGRKDGLWSNWVDADKPIEVGKDEQSSSRLTPVTEKYDAGSVTVTAPGEYTLKFKTAGKMESVQPSKQLFTPPKSALSGFKITLDNSGIKFKENYQFVIGNYADTDYLKFEMIKKNNQTYVLDIIQYTRRGTVDRVFFKLGTDGYEVSRMENFQPDVSSIYICPYNLNRIKGNQVNLGESALVDQSESKTLTMYASDPLCYQISKDFENEKNDDWIRSL